MPTRLFRISLLSCLLLTALWQGAKAQETEETPTAPVEQKAPDKKPPEPAKAPDAKDTKPAAPPAKPAPYKPYKDVITADAKSDPGLFTVHRIEDKIYFEIPANQLNKEMLWTTEIEQLPPRFGFGGTPIGDRVVRWTRRNKRVFLRNVDYSVRAEGGKGGIVRAVQAVSLEPIIMAFDVETEGKDNAAVIDVTRLFTSDVPEFNSKGAVGGAGVDPGRSYVEKIKSFPTNIETKSTLTYVLGQTVNGVNSVTALIHYSMVALPEKPMAPRLYDSRVGYFTEGFEDYGRPENRVVEREYIDRYRLEKKDPTAKVSDPVKPLVYYISREVPDQWHPYIKKGVEAWQAAFLQAGFSNAIVCKEAPTVEEDPNWDPEDARYSVIRWAPTETENAMGPNVHDPRTGEILSAHIIVWHNILRLGETWYFSQVADLDPRAQRLPLPEPLMGEILQYVLCHEVGHTLGLRHNHKASSSYTCTQLRNSKFTEQYGDEASIMDYGRFNYVAQPGDNARLIPILGPYDKFAIEWGYVPLPNARTPDAEKPDLDRIAARQISDPMLRFGGEDANSQSDPTVQTEDLGSDPIEATTYGLKNIHRIAQMLIPATSKFGDDYEMLDDMYNALLSQRSREFSHVVQLVGGVVQTDYHVGRGDRVYRPVARERQAAAVKFLVDNAFTTPRDLLMPEVLYRIEPTGAADRVLSSQQNLLAYLLYEPRIRRMMDNGLLTQGGSYTVAQMMRDLQSGLWSELLLPAPRIDLCRRNLQRAYLAILKTKLVGEGATRSELRPVAESSLRELGQAIDRVLPRVKDHDTAIHLRDCRIAIERTLNPLNPKL